jgi:hypothetical protein
MLMLEAAVVMVAMGAGAVGVVVVTMAVRVERKVERKVHGMVSGADLAMVLTTDLGCSGGATAVGTTT